MSNFLLFSHVEFAYQDHFLILLKVPKKIITAMSMYNTAAPEGKFRSILQEVRRMRKARKVPVKEEPR